MNAKKTIVKKIAVIEFAFLKSVRTHSKMVCEARKYHSVTSFFQLLPYPQGIVTVDVSAYLI